MTTNKAGSTVEGSHECCMCGDFGFSYELFQCKACQFRSQHRYCSNLYPNAESYRICNWCLTQKEETKEKSQNSSNSSSSCKKDQDHLHHNHDTKINKIKKNSPKTSHDHHPYGSGLRGSMKLQPSERGSSQMERRRRLRRLEDTIRGDINIKRISNHGITRQVFRNKVRRYKLLDEVSSQ
ncbi:hypothetical protein M0R45_027369 [Rubus argutus]|uniref:PHD-type zinc finger plants domain-containing protein n=1 Tax=Rubus argutus TaxID=59490 RepID=A0AAW1X418_RUBAR